MVHGNPISQTLIPLSFGARVPTPFGVFRAAACQDGSNGTELLALSMGHLRGVTDVLTRLHLACLTGDGFSSLRCDRGHQLHDAMKQISAERLGVLVYNSSHEGRGIGLYEKLRAHRLQGMDTVDANLALGHPADASKEF